MEKKEKSQEVKEIQCSNCGSKFIYIRIKDKSIVCRKCGHITKSEEDKK